jgi:RNA polymerase sigma factor (TIGR02999 family)
MDPAELVTVVYTELRRLAAAYMRRERPDDTLQPTALVHEAYLRLAREKRVMWQGKTHFSAMAAIQMRRILVERARRRAARRRGGGWRRVTLDEGGAVTSERSLDMLALDAALKKLLARSPRQGQIAEFRIFGGLSEAELAEHFELSERTVRADWRVARAWLARELRA